MMVNPGLNLKGPMHSRHRWGSQVRLIRSVKFYECKEGLDVQSWKIRNTAL